MKKTTTKIRKSDLETPYRKGSGEGFIFMDTLVLKRLGPQTKSFLKNKQLKTEEVAF